jgi:hypothetical protein
MMELHDACRCPPGQVDAGEFDEIEEVISSLSAGSPAPAERRRSRRMRLRGRATLRLVGITPTNQPHVVETYDANEWAIGFFSRSAVALGAEATMTPAGPDGRLLHLHGYLGRSSEVRPGWYHAAVVFYRPNMVLANGRQ